MSDHDALTPDQIERLLADTEPYVSCDECFDRLDVYVETLLDGGPGDPGMAAHLRGCVACAEEAESLGELVRADRAHHPHR